MKPEAMCCEPCAIGVVHVLQGIQNQNSNTLIYEKCCSYLSISILTQNRTLSGNVLPFRWYEMWNTEVKLPIIYEDSMSKNWLCELHQIVKPCIFRSLKGHHPKLPVTIICVFDIYNQNVFSMKPTVRFPIKIICLYHVFIR